MKSSENETLVARTQTLVDIAVVKAGKGGYSHLVETALALPREIWFMYAVKYLESYSYFILAYTLVMYLSDEFGFGDEQAAWTYGIYGMLVSVYGLGMGVVIDHFGVRRSLLVGLSMLIGCRVMLANTQSPIILLIFLFTVLPLGAAMTLPVLQIGIKRYTTDANRTVAFSGFYIVMNLSAMTAAPCIDEFHRWIPAHGSLVGGQLLTPYRSLILLGGVLSFVSLLITYHYIHDEDEATSDSPPRQVSLNSFREAFRSDAFWRFVLLAVLLLGVRSIYRHLDATFPKFMIRTFGKSTPYGALIALNPICVVLVTALATPLSARFHPVPVIIFGSFLSAFSPFILALGHSYANAVLFVLMLSIGEGIWSPRLYEYSVMIAEKGREGTYMALAAAPMFLATLLTGATSGILLENFTPDHGPQHPETLWALIGLTSFMSPVLMLLLRPVIEQPIKRDPEE
jgi:MFS family permease